MKFMYIAVELLCTCILRSYFYGYKKNLQTILPNVFSDLKVVYFESLNQYV